MYIYIYICMYIYVYTYIYTYTYIEMLSMCYLHTLNTHFKKKVNFHRLHDIKRVGKL